MRRFKQLSRADRLKIEALLKAGHGKQEIADLIGVHVSTIYRELQRGMRLETDISDIAKGAVPPITRLLANKSAAVK